MPIPFDQSLFSKKSLTWLDNEIKALEIILPNLEKEDILNWSELAVPNRIHTFCAIGPQFNSLRYYTGVYNNIQGFLDVVSSALMNHRLGSTYLKTNQIPPAYFSRHIIYNIPHLVIPKLMISMGERSPVVTKEQYLKKVEERKKELTEAKKRVLSSTQGSIFR